MFGFRVPILSVVIGEGGSGGALAIGCANRNLIMEHSVYYVASPEACAAILWKARDKAATVSAPYLSAQRVFFLCQSLPNTAATVNTHTLSRQCMRSLKVEACRLKHFWVDKHTSDF